jgi:hypothetical protein
MMSRQQTQETVAKYAATQSIAEIGLGSLLHAARVPFTGHFLSLNQAAVMTWAAKTPGSRRERLSVLSATALAAALLKSFSPVGKRLTPMLAISAQGLLFASGVLVAGANTVGLSLGAVLLGAWAFVQPVLLAYFLFGAPFFQAVIALWRETAETVGISFIWGPAVLGGFIAFKILAAVALVNYLWWRGDAVEEDYSRWVHRLRRRVPLRKSPTGKAHWRLALQDLLNPWFLTGFALSLVFFIYSGAPGEWRIFFYVLRVLLAAWLMFLLVRSAHGGWLAPLLKRFPPLAKAMNQIFKSESRT